MSLFDKFADTMGAVAEKIDGSKYLTVIKNTFTTLMPFIIVGSFATLGNSLLTSKTSGLAQFPMFSFLAALAPAFSALNFATMSMMTVSVVFIMGTLLARRNKENETLSAIAALCAYISCPPKRQYHG